MTDHMRRWTMDGLGKEQLQLREMPVPEPAPGEILVKVGAVSLNYRDKLAIESGMGLDLDFPFTPASDLAGTVVALGARAHRFATGERVISTFYPDWIDGAPEGDARNLPSRTLGGLRPGVLADYVAFPETWFARAPVTLADAEASTLPCAGLTAWTALVEHGRVHAGQTVLIEGTGGVAIAGLQIAKAHGARVIVVSGSADKRDRARALGADHAIDRMAGDWSEEVLRITADQGVDHVLELVGGANLANALKVVAIGGHIALIGVFDGFEISGPTQPLLLKQATIRGVAVGHRRSLEALVSAVDESGISPVVDRRHPMAELPAALDHLARGAFGKVVIDIS